MINKVFLIGHVGNKPVVKEGKTGNKYATFSIATNSGYGDKRVTEWHSLTCFGKQAEFVEQYLDKGMMIFIEGHIQYESFEKDGKKSKSTKIIAETVKIVSSKEKESESKQIDDNPFIDSINDDIPY